MPIINSKALTKEKNTRRLFVLIISRIVIVTLFLSITIFVDIRKHVFPVSQITINFFYIIAAAIYFFSIIYILLFKFVKDFQRNIYLQITVDVILITFLISLTGNTQIDYSLFYTLVIIYSVIFLGRTGGFIVATASSIFYGLLMDFQFYKLVPFVSSSGHDYDLNFTDVLTNILVHIVSFYVLAILASFVVEQEKKTRSLLEEKESEFNQLDLLFRSIVESVYTGVMTIDLQNTIKTFNFAAEEITGFTLAKVQDCKIEDVFPEFLPFLIDETINEQTKKRLEVIITGKTGNKINLGLSISPLKGRHDNQIGNILVFQDLTKIKQMEENLEKSKNMALIGELAAGLAHEMRNPLAAITGSIELLEQGLKLDGTDKRLMQIILRGKDQLDNFAHDFLLLARPVPVSRELVDLNKIIEEVLEYIRLNKNWTSKIKIVKVFASKAEAFANKEQVRQIINNLVLNAIQSMEEGGVLSIETKVARQDDKKEYAEIKVSDTGCGIKENDLKKIFEPFFTNKEKGTGLGLTIVNHIVEGYNGKIKIESNINHGTVCFVWLPVKNEEHM
ncbi:MAG: ATP-binding protein [Smithella sp.]|jgi:two-component system sensor histidine kinase PilS (NtrC family)